MKKILLILNLILLIPNLANSQVANQPSDLVTCDYADNGGFAQFDLTVNNAQILGEQDPTLFAVSYYQTQADADSGVYALTSPYVNSSNPQPIIARINDLSNENFDITNFQIMVLSLPTIADISPIEVCDDTYGASNDGSAEFDLFSLNEEILNGQDPTLFVVSYHQTQADADMRINPLGSQFVIDSSPMHLIVRITNELSGCYNSNIFEIIVIDCTDLNINSFEPNQFRVYPNPSKSMIYIEGVYEGADISIFDSQGSKIMLDIQKASNKKLNINVTKLNRGIYLLRIQDNSKEEIHKLIVD